MSTENKSIVTDGIKSQDRVKKHGEVFTPVHIVRDMTAMVNKALHEKLDEHGITSDADKAKELLKKTWLEPACGTGNFLVEILKDKLSYVEMLAKPEDAKLDMYTLMAVATIYAIDIQLDNVLESRARLIDTPAPTDIENGYETLTAWYKRYTGAEMSANLLDSARYITEKNIIHGNALTGTYYEGAGDNAKDTKRDMIIIEWIFNNSGECRLDDVTFNSLKDGSTGSSKDTYGKKYFKITNLRQAESNKFVDACETGEEVTAAEANESLDF